MKPVWEEVAQRTVEELVPKPDPLQEHAAELLRAAMDTWAEIHCCSGYVGHRTAYRLELAIKAARGLKGR